MYGRRPKAWEDPHSEHGGRVGPPIVWPEDEWGADIVGEPVSQACELGPGAHMWSGLVILNPWYLWFRSIRGVLACSCEVACAGQAAIYGMVGGSFGSRPFFACAPHWAWLAANHYVNGGHCGAVLGVGADSTWDRVSQDYDPGASLPDTPEAPGHRQRQR